MWGVVRRSVVFGACSGDWDEMQSSGKSQRSTSSDGSQVRLSRRSSVLVDLLSLFRKPSSTHASPARLPGQNLIEPARDVKEVEETEAFLQTESEDEDSKPMSREKLLEQIRQKKEVIGKLRGQPWSMRRKRRTLKLAQRYLQRHESKVSKTHLYKEEITKRWHHFLRWMKNVQIYLIPWEAKIKRIESHFGSVVSSYFTFLRWVLGVNVTMTLIIIMFVTIPEMLSDAGASAARYNSTYARKVMPEDVRKQSDELHTVWDYKGYMEYSLLFYGYYGSETYMGDTVQYSVPVAYFLSFLFVLGYSFFTILRKMAANARSSKMASGKAEQYIFNWNVFAGWDFTIGNPETAANAVMANVNKLRETIAEYQVKQKKKFLWIRLAARIATNTIFLTMLGLSVWAIQAVGQITDKDTFLKQNAVSITVSFITLVFPNIFELVGRMERYHPRTALRIQLARVLSLYIVNYYTLILSLFLMKESLKDTMAARDQFGDHRFKRSPFDVGNDSLLAESLLSASMPNNDSLLWSILSRTTRQAIDLGNTEKAAYYGYTTAPTPWTTVLPNYGPVSVNGIKVTVGNNVSPLSDSNTSVFEARPMGPGSDWSQPATTRGINSSHYSGFLHNFTQKPAVAQRITSDSFDDLCWETMIGQEITKLVTMDLLMTIASVFIIDFFRGLWVRYCNEWWCWNLETVFPEYGEFKVAENVLHLVNNQGMIWLGLFFVPLLPAINNIKLIILMYIRGWAVMTCNVPAQQIFRASRSSNFYLMLLLLMLFLCTLPVGYVIASEKPSNSCGPFGNKRRFYNAVTDVLQTYLSRSLLDILRYVTSPGIVIPVLLLLLLVIYFLVALVRGLREANSDLQTQLTHERTEEKRKIFQLAGGRKRPVHPTDPADGVIEHALVEHVEAHSIEIQGETQPPLNIEMDRSTRSPVTSNSPTLLAPPNVRSMTSSKHFIPSLGSLHEDDNISELEDDKISAKHSSQRENSMNHSGTLSFDETLNRSGSTPKFTSPHSPVDTVDFRCANSRSQNFEMPPKLDSWDSSHSKESERSLVYTDGGSRMSETSEARRVAGLDYTTPTPREQSISSMTPSFTPQDLEQLIGRSTPLTRSFGDGQSYVSSPAGPIRAPDTQTKQSPENDFGAFVSSSRDVTQPIALNPAADVAQSETETTEIDESGTDYVSTDDCRPLTKRETPKEAFYRPTNRFPSTSMTDRFMAWPAPSLPIQQTSIESEEPDERLKWVKRKPRFRISSSPTRRVNQDSGSSDTDSSAKRKFVIRTAPATTADDPADDDADDDRHRLLPQLHAPPKSGANSRYRDTF